MNNKPIPHSVIEENNIADHFVDLVKSKLTNPEHLNAALRLFIAGRLPIDLISKPGMIDLPALRKQIAGNIRERRRKWFESMAEQRRLFGYYSGCTMVRHNAGKTVHFAFIDKSGHLVALGMDDGKNGGVYYANNPVQTIHPDELPLPIMLMIQRISMIASINFCHTLCAPINRPATNGINIPK